ncbi:MAG: tRNA lysidine(34) synthetase TilS [Bacteroidales bacterium]
MLETFQRQYAKGELFSAGQKILLAASGGIDSMVMVRLFEMSGLDFGIAHVNFHLRGEESNGDMALVKKIADEINVPFFGIDFDTKAWAHQQKLSIQEAARELRYNWFEQLIGQTDFELYATAHHFDDQIETFFINLLRGTGVSGLRGIRPKNGNCIRPLLYATRPEIENFARDHGIRHREDSSNQSNAYLRNRIRKNLIPELAYLDPDFRTGFRITFQNLSDAESFIGSQAERIKERLVTKKDNQFIISRKELEKIAEKEFLLWKLLKSFGFNRTAVRNISLGLRNTPGGQFYSETHQLLIDREELLIRPVSEGMHSKTYLIERGQQSIDTPIHLSLHKSRKEQHFIIDPDPDLAQLDFDKLEFPLTLRKPRQGDYFYPLGLGGRKLVSDFLTDLKLPARQRLNTRLLISRGKIAWIIGLRIDDRFKITSETSEILSIRWNKEYSEA